MVGAGLTNMWSMYGTNDIPSVLIAYFGGIPNKQTLPLYLDRSAMTHIDKVTTPTLILHGANDERVPTGQAYELFRGLKDRGKTTELVFYPREGHGITEYYHQKDRLHAHLRLGDEVHAWRRWKPRHNDINQRRRADSAGQRSDAELLAILAELGREVTSVLDLDELLEKIPQLISRLTPFTRLLRLPAGRATRGAAHRLRRRLSRGDRQALHAARSARASSARAVAEQRPILLDDVDPDPRYLAVVPGAKSQLAVPLRNKGKVIGALNLLSDQLGAFTERDEWILRQFGAHVAQAIATARLFESEREYAETLETLAEIGREMSAILDLDELLTRLAHLVKRVIDYRTFGIALLDEETQMLEMKVDDQLRRRSARGRSRSSSARAWSATPRCTRKWCWCPT